MTDTVTPQREPTSKGGMDLFGKLMFLGMVVLMIPLFPLYLLLKGIYALLGDTEPER